MLYLSVLFFAQVLIIGNAVIQVAVVESPCPKGVDIVACVVDPCLNAECPANPEATCVANYCGGCNTDFYDTDGNVAICHVACPKIGCERPCRFGYKIGPDGCPTCHCLPPACPKIGCGNPCPFGYKVGLDGCPTCHCLPKPDCKGDLVFSKCASACPPTCENPDVICRALCRPGCACPEGTILTKPDSARCVHPKTCRCLGIKGYLSECRLIAEEE